MSWTRSYSCVTLPFRSAPNDSARMMTSETSAAGSAILKFSRNLSFIWQPWP